MHKYVFARCRLVFMVLCLCLLAGCPAFAAAYKDATAQEILNVVQANRGKVVVVNVFASWCPPCRSETPDLVRFYEQMAGKDVVLFGVSLDESGPDLERFIARYRVPYPVYRGSEDFLRYLGAYSIPQLLVFDANGKQVEHLGGMISLDELVRLVEPYLERGR